MALFAQCLLTLRLFQLDLGQDPGRYRREALMVMVKDTRDTRFGGAFTTHAAKYVRQQSTSRRAVDHWPH